MQKTLCIAGKNQIAVDLLKEASRIEGVRLVCLPTEVDRGYEGWQPSLFATAEQMSIPVVMLDDLYEINNLVFLSLEYDKIIRPARFRNPDALFNIHFSLLPKYRGCNTAIWPILNGEREHGVSLHVIDAGVDTGDIIEQVAFGIDDFTARDVYFKCMRLGTDLCVQMLPKLISGHFDRQPQDPSEGSTYKRKDLDFSLKKVNLNQTTQDVLRQIRAFTFVEYQLPIIEGLSVLEAWDVRDIPSINESHDVLIRETRDGRIALRVTSKKIHHAALQQSGY